MPVYSDDRRRVCGWNAVDVFIDGQLQHGDVVNLAPGGLIVDFRCANQRQEFIEHGSAYHCRNRFSDMRTPRSNEQVLLRRYPDGAWIWYSGEAVPGGFDCFDARMMEVQLPQGAVRQLVPDEQIRPAPSVASMKHQRVEMSDFVIRSCSLPAAYWSAASQLCGEIFKFNLSEQYNVRCTSLLSQTLHYLQRDNGAPLTGAQVEVIYKTAKKATETSKCQYFLNLFRQRITTPNKPRKISGDPYNSLPLPVELLLEVFRSLDSIGRIRCRRVCQVWSTLLTSEGYFPDVRVSDGDPDDFILTIAWHGIYWAASCLLKCLTSRTKMVIIMSADRDRCRELTGLISSILKPNRMPTLVFYECELGFEGERLDEVVNFMVTMFLECAKRDRVVWKKCKIDEWHLKSVIGLYSLKTKSKVELERELWDVFEKNLILTKVLNRPALATSIADCIAHRPSLLTEAQLVKILNYYQRLDPRLSTHYRHRKWTTAVLKDLDAAKLTTLTAAASSEGIEISDFGIDDSD